MPTATAATSFPIPSGRHPASSAATAPARAPRRFPTNGWWNPTVSIGSTIPQQREIDVSVVQRSDLIVCDVLDEVLHDTGDMIAARAAGIEVERVAVSLADVMSGACAEQLATSRNRLFKSVGSGLQDIVVAGLVLDLAREVGLAVPLPIAFDTKPM